jgi:uncharacterized protein with HEPN domain
MNKDDLVRLRHILDAAREAVGFTQDVTREAFESDRKLVLALVKDIEIIGEAASKVSKEAQEAYPQFPWPQMVSMRNRLIHAYFEIDVETVWKTVKEDLPPLIAELEKVIQPDETA